MTANRFRPGYYQHLPEQFGGHAAAVLPPVAVVEQPVEQTAPDAPVAHGRTGVNCVLRVRGRPQEAVTADGAGTEVRCTGGGEQRGG